MAFSEWELLLLNGWRLDVLLFWEDIISQFFLLSKATAK
jgi:hypothetical protein